MPSKRRTSRWKQNQRVFIVDKEAMYDLLLLQTEFIEVKNILEYLVGFLHDLEASTGTTR